MRHLVLGMAPHLRGEAVLRLAGLFRDYGLVSTAEHDLTARHPRTRIRAVEALGAMGVSEAEPWLLAGLGDDDRLMRFACARALAALGATDSLARVVAALADSEAQLGATSDILLAFGAPATDFLCAHVRAAPTERERWLAAHALGQMRAAEALEDLRAVLSSPDPELAVRAARGLGRIGSAEASTDLAVAAQGEQSWFVRAAAARSLGKIGDPDSAPLLVSLLATAERWEVRDAAAGALVDLGDPAMAILVQGLGEMSDLSLAHYAGALDVADLLGAVIERAAAGEAGPDALMRRACGAGVRARLEEKATGATAPAATYARALLVS
ncbi:MAG: HEAT repeat domain-containing protein [Solirubrobacteraceae bacterium]